MMAGSLLAEADRVEDFAAPFGRVPGLVVKDAGFIAGDPLLDVLLDESSDRAVGRDVLALDTSEKLIGTRLGHGEPPEMGCDDAQANVMTIVQIVRGYITLKLRGFDPGITVRLIGSI